MIQDRGMSDGVVLVSWCCVYAWRNAVTCACCTGAEEEVVKGLCDIRGFERACNIRGFEWAWRHDEGA